MRQKELIVQNKSGKAHASVSDYIIAELAKNGVTHIFGYPGASILPVMAAIDRHPTVEWVLMRNEASAALAASAHAKLTRKMAVCMATSGPGATNLITGLLDAQCDSAPVLAITGLVQTWRQGRYEFQDIDSAKVLGDLLSHSVRCDHPDQLPPMLHDCLGRAIQQDSVVHMAIATDVQSFVPAAEDERFHVVQHTQGLFSQPPQERLIEKIGAELSAAGHVVIAVGPGAIGAGGAIEDLALKLSAPIITAFSGKGIIDESHPCAMGVLGIFGAPGAAMANKVINNADTILAFGLTDSAPFVAGQNGVQTRALYQCEIESGALTHKFQRKGTLIGPLKDIALSLVRATSETSNKELLNEAIAERRSFKAEWEESVDKQDTSFVHPVRFLQALNGYLEPESILTLDIGDNAVWAAQFLELTGRQRVLVSENLGVMGFALPAAIAASLARPTQRVVAIAGDGGLQMTIGELATAAQYGANFVLIIFNNGILGRIYAQQKKQFGSFLKNPDFVALARAYGFAARKVDSEQDIVPALKSAFEFRDRPFVIEVRCDANILAPMSKWDDGFTPLHFS